MMDETGEKPGDGVAKAEEKKLKGRYAHIKDYRQADDGSYEYVGIYHEWADADEAVAFARQATILSAAAIACLAVAGCVPAPGTFGAFYVVVPYLCAVLGVALSAAAFLRLVREGTRVRDHIYEKSVPMLPVKLGIGLAGAFSCAMGELAHVIVVGAGDKLAFGLVFVALMLASGVCLLLLLRLSMPLVRGEAWKR